MRSSRLQTWVDAHFFEIVPLLAVIGCVRWTFHPVSLISISIAVIPAICGAFGCYFWAIYLRKPAPLTWFILGFFPVLPELYLLGWHKGLLHAKRIAGPPPLDCPRCGMRLLPSARCPNCDWTRTEA